MSPSANVHAGVGAGRFRNPWRIREFLASRGLSMAAIARDIGIGRSAVCATVRGTQNNRRTLHYLDEIGCPREHLSLPPDMM